MIFSTIQGSFAVVLFIAHFHLLLYEYVVIVISLEKEMATHSSILACKISWAEGNKESDKTQWLSTATVANRLHYF